MLQAYTWLKVSMSEFSLRDLVSKVRREDGGVAAEYAILITLIALVIVAGATALGIAINNTLNDASTVAPLGGGGGS
jgi:Flp pilus assembly pilin Flp